MFELSRTLRGLLCCTPLLIGSVQAQSVGIAPSSAMVGVGFTQQFKATVTGLSNTAVTWSVAGNGAGNATVGTITSAGLYTAPVTLPGQNPVTVRATASDGKTAGTVYVLIEPLGPNLTSVSPNPLPVGSFNITVTGTGFLPGALIFVGGVQLPTTLVSSSSLKAAGWEGAVQSQPVKVKNPGSLFSNTITVPVGSGGTTFKISPSAASVVLGAMEQFTSTSAATWTASAGTIGTTGLYTAPPTMPPTNTVTITATGSSNQSATATVTLLPSAPSPITVTPATANVTLGLTQQFTATGQSSVTWSASVGSISTTGLFTAPLVMPASSIVTIKATGTGNQSGMATVTLVPLPSPVTVTPSTANVTLGVTQQFTATGQSGVTWSASAGTISTSGLFTAPTVMPASSTVTITATGTGNQSGTATVTLVAAPSPITVTPATANVALGATQQFMATGQSSVTWSASAGLISVTGLFTAPSVMPALNTVTITAKGSGNQSGTATVTLSGGANPQMSSAAAHRFLQQAAFGPTPADVAHLQNIGYQAWLNEQFAMAPVSNYNPLLASSQSGFPQLFLANAVTNPDQLRQRVGFALSQITVISITKLIWNNNIVPFENMLLNDAFTNYRQILGDVTLNPSMGFYLDMANNAAANPGAGTVANENFAREIMQLFSIGTTMLNPDGTVQKDASGNLVPTYNQTNVTELARVFTGWTFTPASGSPQWGINVDGNTNMNVPMVSIPAFHDAGSKNLLNGFVSPAGVAPAQDLQGALDNIFNHPNVGPFISKQLIQHLVKSNPSPAYVARVVAAFNNNGHGVRGDMQAILTAILLDPEARANDNGGLDQPTDGHLQEPVVYVAAIVRGLDGQMNTQNYFAWDLGFLAQDIFNPASVFNYYSPNYGVPGTTLQGGEFQIFDTFTSIYRANLVSGLFSNYSDPVQTYGPGTTVDLTPYVALAANPAALVNALDNALTGGVLPASLKQIVTSAVQAEAGTSALHQVQTALYLILTSNYYNVWH
jgi:uncharacterized protein (DUF1800 family)